MSSARIAQLVIHLPSRSVCNPHTQVVNPEVETLEVDRLNAITLDNISPRRSRRLGAADGPICLATELPKDCYDLCQPRIEGINGSPPEVPRDPATPPGTMKLLLLSVLLSALPAALYAVPLPGRPRKVHTWRLRQGWLAGPMETRHHLGGGPDEQADLGSVEEDPEPSTQILMVNEASGKSPIGQPPLEFGDIAVDPLGNADQCASDRCRWPRADNGQVLVPYEISSSYSSNERGVIMAAIQSFSPSTCISFKPRTDESDYLFIEPQTGCWSFIGRTGGRQVVSLQRNGCVFLGTAQHELLHALGFHHEQNRGDRDGFVDILLQNVMRGMENNFEKVNTNNLGTRYDYASIMHYSRNAFSVNGRPTIVPKPDPNVAIGTSRQFTSTDITKINLLYCSN